MPFPRRKSYPAPLAKVLANVYPSRNPDDLRSIRAFIAWEKAVPDRVASNVRPVRLTKGSLLLHASSSVWVQEVSLLQQDLLDRLRSVQPDAGIRTLRIRVGPLPERPMLPAAKPPIPKRDLTALPEPIARELAAVRDDTLRFVLSSAAAASCKTEPTPEGPKR